MLCPGPMLRMTSDGFVSLYSCLYPSPSHSSFGSLWLVLGNCSPPSHGQTAGGIPKGAWYLPLRKTGLGPVLLEHFDGEYCRLRVEMNNGCLCVTCYPLVSTLVTSRGLAICATNNLNSCIVYYPKPATDQRLWI